MRSFGAVLGAVLILAVWINIATTLVIPRGRAGFVKLLDSTVDRVYRGPARLMRSYEARDRLLSSQPVVTLGALLGLWLAALGCGFALLLWPANHRFSSAWRESGSSLFTLGFAVQRSAGPTVIDLVAAASGLVVVALQIAYLPTLYGAYNRRETEVTLLGARAGVPTWGPELLARVHLANSAGRLSDIYQQWERWSADVAESHSNYPSLLRFRSPDAHLSWIVAQLAVLDAAALQLAACPDDAPMSARMCLQMGIYGLAHLGRTLRIPLDDDPRPDALIELSWDEFLVGWQRLESVGFPLQRPAEEAWPHFRGWRINYEQAAYRLARAVDAVPALWSGPRRYPNGQMTPRRIVNRTPEHPEGSPPFPPP